MSRFEVMVAVGIGLLLLGLVVMVAVQCGTQGPSRYRLDMNECAAWCGPSGGVERWERSRSRQVNPGAKTPAYVSETFCECVLPASGF